MALHIDCNRVHSDMRGSQFHMDRKRRAITPKSLRTNSELIDCGA